MTNPDGSTVEFSYNAKGQRTEKVAKNSTGTILSDTQYQYDDVTGNLVVEANVTTGTTVTYSYDATGRRISQTQGGNTYYYNYDGHGNVVALTDGAGNVVVTYSYDPWGKVLSKTGTLYNPFTYSGYYRDEETGLYYLINRYYDPEDGRFLSQDAVDPVDGNLYVYAVNDPVNMIDPDGNYALTLNDFEAKMLVGPILVSAWLTVAFSSPYILLSGGDSPPQAKPNNKTKPTKTIEKIDDKYLKKKGIDAHEVKREFLGRKAKIAEYDLYRDKKSGEILIYRKGGKGEGIPTGQYIK